MVPADDQAIVLPWASVMVIIVLLNEAFTCATPEAMFLRSRRRTRVASLPIHDPFAARLRNRRRRTCSLSRGPRQPFSCRRWLWPALCGCAHWYACAGPVRAGHGGAATRGSSRDPSVA